jgi:hypothetical protein
VRCADRAAWFHLPTVERQHGLALFLQLAEDIADDWVYFQVAVHYTNTQQSRSVRSRSGGGQELGEGTALAECVASCPCTLCGYGVTSMET